MALTADQPATGLGVADVLVAKRRPTLEAGLEHLLRQFAVLQRIAEQQHTLIPGCVAPQQSWIRLDVANRINEACQQLELDLTDTSHGEQWREELKAIRGLAESILRENPVLQARGPLCVIRFEDIPERYVLNRDRRRELRKGFGLHRGVKNDEGPSVVIAFTPPAYEQMWHAHTVDEYTLVLDTQFAGRYIDSGVRELAPDDEELIHFCPLTYHALANRGTRPGRTLTLKYPLGISIWLPALKLTGAERGWAEVRSVPWVRKGEHEIRRFQIKDSYHRYAVNIATLTSQVQFELTCDEDGYFYVLDGRIGVCRETQTVTASTDDLIVVKPTRSLRIRAETPGARLYWVSDVVYVPVRIPRLRSDPVTL